MLFNNIKIGDRLEITNSGERDLLKSYVSQVEDILGESELLVHMPISYGQLVRLPMINQYSVLFFTERGMTRFDAKVTGYSKENELSFMSIRILSGGERIQRREFFRYSCLIPLKFASSDEEEQGRDIDNEDSRNLMDGIIKDLGAGGVRFASNESIAEELVVKCIIMLSDDVIVSIGKVLHKQFFPKSNYKYQYRVQFIGITPREQEKISQYIFNEQKKLNKRGIE